MRQTTFYLWNSHVITNLLEFLHFNPSPTTSVASTEQHFQSSSRAGVGHCFTILTVFCIIMLNNYCFFVGMYECYLKVKVSSNKTNDIAQLASSCSIPKWNPLYMAKKLPAPLKNCRHVPKLWSKFTESSRLGSDCALGWVKIDISKIFVNFPKIFHVMWYWVSTISLWYASRIILIHSMLEIHHLLMNF